MTTTLSRIAELRATLDDLALALTEARTGDLLDLETRLAAAVAALPAEPPDDLSDRDAARVELAHARQRLMACRRLGANLQDFVRWSVQWASALPQYDAHGHAAGQRGTAAAALDVRG